MYVIMCHNTDLSGPADLETLELLESESESLRSYEVHLYKGNYTLCAHTSIYGQPYCMCDSVQPAELHL